MPKPGIRRERLITMFRMDFTALAVVTSSPTLPATPEGAGLNALHMLLLALAILGLALLMRKTGRRIANARREPRPSVRKRFAELERQQETRRDVEAVMLELDQLARQIHGRLDTKLAQLETVIRDADERIDRLSRLTGDAHAGHAVDVTLEPEEPHGLPLEQNEPHGHADGTSENKEEQHSAVYRLADGGVAPVDIAQETGQTAGEIELILALRRAKARPPACPSESVDAALGAMDR